MWIERTACCRAAISAVKALLPLCSRLTLLRGAGRVPQPRATICSTASPRQSQDSAAGTARRYPAST